MRKYILVALIFPVIWIPTIISEYFFYQWVTCTLKWENLINCIRHFERSIGVKSSKEALSNRDYLLQKQSKTSKDLSAQEDSKDTNSQSRDETTWTSSGSTASGSKNTPSESMSGSKSSSWSVTGSRSENIPGFSSTGTFENLNSSTLKDKRARIEQRSTELRNLQKNAGNYTRLDGIKEPNEIQSLLDTMFGERSINSKDY